MTGRPHRAVKVDANQAEIVEDLRRLGAVVWNLSSLGGKVLDILVCWRGKCVPVEIKAIGREDKLTDGETEAIQRLQLVGIEPIIATCVEDVVSVFYKTAWRVVDQAAINECNKLMAEAMEKATKSTRHSHATPYQKQRVCKLRDSIFQAYDALCMGIEKS